MNKLVQIVQIVLLRRLNKIIKSMILTFLDRELMVYG